MNLPVAPRCIINLMYERRSPKVKYKEKVEPIVLKSWDESDPKIIEFRSKMDYLFGPMDPDPPSSQEIADEYFSRTDLSGSEIYDLLDEMFGSVEERHAEFKKK